MAKGRREEKRETPPSLKRRSKYYVVIGIVIGIAAIAGAVSLASSNAPSGAGPNLTVAPGTVSVEGLKVEQSAPDFSLIDPQKGSISKATFQGKPLMIFFTTTWCTPCQIGAQNLARYDDETRGNAFNVLIVFVDPRETDSQFIDWKQKYGRDDWYISEGVEMAQNYEVRYLDTKYVFDKSGIIKWVDLKPLEYSKSKQVLEPLLA